MTLEEIERELRAAMDAAIRDGWFIDTGSMFPAENSCCALGSLVRSMEGRGDNDAFYAAIRKLGITPDQGTALARAFDGLSTIDYDKTFAELGERLAADYVK